MDFPGFAQGNFWASSETLDGALPQPPQVANTHRLVHDSPFYSEIPQQKMPRNIDNISHLRNPGVGNKETTTDFAYNMDHDHHWEFGGSRNCNYRGMNRFWNGVGDIKHSVCHEMTRNYNVDRRLQHGMGLCKFIFRGQECPYGERCSFLHERMGKWGESSRVPDERWEKDEFSEGSMRSDAINIKFSYSKDSSLAVECRSSKMLSWKTRLCNKFEMHGTCPYDMRCIFAHGQAELRKNVAFAAPASASKGSSTSRTDQKETLKCEARVGACDEQVVEKQSSFKWNRLRKIEGIYADWIEENTMSQQRSFNGDGKP